VAVGDFETVPLVDAPSVVAPDGSDVRILPQLPGGSMAHFTLAPGVTSRAVTHRTVEEIWFVMSGRGEMWRATSERDEVVALEPGVALTIPLGTRFQFRASGSAPLTAIAVTMPPWPDDAEATAVDGPWEPTV
jgi:mannose-6-phosphate isomerase-like protein (cupin superfamily)